VYSIVSVICFKNIGLVSVFIEKPHRNKPKELTPGRSAVSGRSISMKGSVTRNVNIAVLGDLHSHFTLVPGFHFNMYDEKELDQRPLQS